jgi:hypothetical protein
MMSPATTRPGSLRVTSGWRARPDTQNIGFRTETTTPPVAQTGGVETRLEASITKDLYMTYGMMIFKVRRRLADNEDRRRWEYSQSRSLDMLRLE